MHLPTVRDIREATARIAPHAHRTPVLRCTALDEAAGAEIHLKCENLQKVGAFKFRGALNAVLALSDSEAGRGVCTHSSGNHAAALALAARVRGIAAHVVMPSDSAPVKLAAVGGYGAQVTLCEPSLQAREDTLAAVQARTGAVFIHPYDHPLVIAGQATTAVELLEQAGPLDVLLAPVGGGGLLSGVALAAHYLRPEVDVFAAEPQAADDAHRSLRAGRLLEAGSTRTVADGLRTSLSERTFAALQQHVRDVVTVPEADILPALRFVWERAKLVIEPSAAVPVAAALRGVFAGKRVGLVLSGGNVDLNDLSSRWAAG